MVHPTGKSPSQVFTNLFIPDGTPEQHPWWNELERLTVSPENAARTLEAFYNVVVSALAGQVRAPTLVMHSRGDARVPFDEGRKLAAMIPGARFVPPESRNHVLLENEAAWPAWTTAPSPGSCGRARRPCATRCLSLLPCGPGRAARKALQEKHLRYVVKYDNIRDRRPG